MVAARIVAAFACILACAPRTSSLTLQGSDPEWDQWLEAANRQPPWLKDAPALQPRIHKRGPKLRVAVLCSGVLKRFFLQETTSGLIGPMTKEGHEVDLFLALNFADFRSFHKGADTLKPDPQFKDKKVYIVKSMITSAVLAAGGHPKTVDLFDGVDTDTKQDKAWIDFPGNWMKGKDNVLKKLKPLERLYNLTVDEETKAGRQYDMMIFLDDDSIWLKPFSLTRLLKATENHKERQLFSLLCGPNSTTITAAGYLTEYIFIANRTVAEALGQQYTTLTTGKLGRKPWNLEQFSARVAWAAGARNIQVSPAAIPMQRGGRFNNSGPIGVCLHKKCVPLPEDPLSSTFERVNPFDHYHVCKEALWKW